MNNRTPALIAVVLVVLAILAALVYMFFLNRHEDATHRTQPVGIAIPSGSGVSRQPTNATAPLLGKPVIYTVSASGGDANDLAPTVVSVRRSQSPARDVLNALTHADPSPLPAGTKLRGVKIEDGLATVDFSQEFQTNFHGGDTEEAQTVNSVLRTLGQFPNIDRVQILVEGKPIEALSQLPISSPLDVIRPDPVRQARTPAARPQ